MGVKVILGLLIVGFIVSARAEVYEGTPLEVDGSYSDMLYCDIEPSNYQEILKAVRDLEHLRKPTSNNTIINWKDSTFDYTGEDDCGDPFRKYVKVYAVREYKRHPWTAVIQTEEYEQFLWIETCRNNGQSCFTKATHHDGCSAICYQEYQNTLLLVSDNGTKIVSKTFPFPSYCSCKEICETSDVEN